MCKKRVFDWQGGFALLKRECFEQKMFKNLTAFVSVFFKLVSDK